MVDLRHRSLECVTATVADMVRLRAERGFRDGPKMHQALRGAATRRVLELGAEREAAARAYFQDAGWTVQRCGDMNPFLWCAVESIDEVADLGNYAVRFPERMDCRPGTAKEMEEIRRATEVHLGQLLILQARAAALQLGDRALTA